MPAFREESPSVVITSHNTVAEVTKRAELMEQLQSNTRKFDEMVHDFEAGTKVIMFDHTIENFILKRYNAASIDFAKKAGNGFTYVMARLLFVKPGKPTPIYASVKTGLAFEKWSAKAQTAWDQADDGYTSKRYFYFLLFSVRPVT